MKMKSFAAILLSVLLIFSVTALVFATDDVSDYQKTLLSKSVSLPPVQDGIINGHLLNGSSVLEYGTAGPVRRLTAEAGDYRALDLSGNALEYSLPSYVDLYLSRDADALYAGIIIQEAHHGGDTYSLTTFLGFGDSSDADTMNTGALTTFVMNNGHSASGDPGTWLDTQVTALSARTVAPDGTVTDSTAQRRYQEPLSYGLPAWGSVGSDSDDNPITIFEVELDFQDTLKGCGLNRDSVPESAYFSFDVGIYSGTQKMGVIRCAAPDLTGTATEPDGEIKSVPYKIDLVQEPAADFGDATLSSLSFPEGSLNRAFSPEVTEYTLTLPYGTSSVTPSYTTTYAYAETLVTGNSALSEEEPILIRVTAGNGAVKTYTINVELALDVTEIYVNTSTGSDTAAGTSLAPYKTLEKALTVIAGKSGVWRTDEAARIHLTGTAASSGEILFGQSTVFNAGGERLPITILGAGSASTTVSVTSSSSAAANSYTFEDLTFQTPASSSVFAGSGEIKFKDVAFSNSTTSFYGDNFTDSAFTGWPGFDALTTSVTFGEGADYAGPIAAQGGSSTGTSSKITAKAIVDGATVSSVLGRAASGVNIAGSEIVIQNGAAASSVIGINGGAHTGDLAITVGKNGSDACAVSELIAAKGDYTLTGYCRLTVKGGTAGSGSGTTATSTAAGGAGALGTVNTISGGTFPGGFIGVFTTGSMTQVGNVVNNVTGGTFAVSFVGGASTSGRSGIPTIANVTNNFSGGSITGSGKIIGESGTASDATLAFVAGSFDSGNAVTNLVNNLSGSARIPHGYGGSRNTRVTHITNNLNFASDGGISSIFYASNRTGSRMHSSIVNNISGQGTVNTFYAASNAGIVENTTAAYFVQTTISGGAVTNFYGGSNSSKVIGNIHNVVTGGAVTNFYGGSNTGTVQGNIVNDISGGNITTFYGGNKAGSELGNITNTISAGSIHSFYGGGESTATGSDTVSVTIQNNLQGGDVYYFFGGNNAGALYGSIVNAFSGGAVNGYVYGGSYNGDIQGSITNAVSGGVINIFYGSLRSGTIAGAVQNTLTGGRFTNDFVAENGASGSNGNGGVSTTFPADSTVILEKDFFGGTNSGKVSSAATTIAGGTFLGNVSPGCKATSSGVSNPTLVIQASGNSLSFSKAVTGTSLVGSGGTVRIGTNTALTVSGTVSGPFTLDQTGNWIDGNIYFSAPASGVTPEEITVSTSGTGSYATRTENGLFLIKGYVANLVSPTMARLVLEQRVGVKLYFTAQDVTEDFTYQVTLSGSATPLAFGTYADLSDEGAYKVLFFTGIGLQDFGTEFALTGETISDPYSSTYNTIIKLAELGSANSQNGSAEQILFRSIADLGRVARGEAAVYGLDYTDLTPGTTGQGPEAGAAISFTGKNLLMEDAIGVRLYGLANTQEDIAAMTVLVGAEDVTSHCAISEGTYQSQSGKYRFTLDLYLNVSKMDEDLSLLVTDGNSLRCLRLNDRVDWIAKGLLVQEPDNDLAKQVLVYIQAVNTYLYQTSSAVIPSPEPGSETPVGDLVDLFD